MTGFASRLTAVGIALWMAASLAAAQGGSVLDDGGHALINGRCVGCHTRTGEDRISRISDQRKTPEGWYMTITRMQHNHGLVLSEREKDAIVKYLSDTQGLAPSEAAPYRYALEHRNNFIERYNAINRPDPQGIAARCTLCHSYARIALQRRTEEQWRLLLNFHLAQYPAIEFQAAALLVPWWQQVQSTLPAVLARQFPLATPQWTQWRDRPKANLSGPWEVIGSLPGVGFYGGLRTITRVAPDSYATRDELRFADGEQDSAAGSAVVYTGYEWRGRTRIRREDVREIFAVSEDGDEIKGRWYVARHPELGAEFRAVRIIPGAARVLAVEPSSIRTDTRERVTLYGMNLLHGVPGFGPGIRAKVVARTGQEITVDIAAAADAPLGPRSVTVGSAPSAATLAVYAKVDHIEVTPAYAFSRLGGGGGKVPDVEAQFEAVAYAVAPGDGRKFSLGAVAAKWTLAPHTKLAKQWNDQLYAGRITGDGLFVPAESGINPLRTQGTVNSSGDLTVNATVVADGRVLQGAAHLVVSTAPLYFNTPIP